MTHGLNLKNLILYIVIVILGLILSEIAADLETGSHRNGSVEEGKEIELRRRSEFIESRSTVKYTLTKNESLDEISWLFGLELDKESILAINKGLDKKDLEGNIPRGTVLILPIQSKSGQKAPIKN